MPGSKKLSCLLHGIILLMLLFCGCTGSVAGDTRNLSSGGGDTGTGSGYVRGDAAVQMNSLIVLLQDLGLDISYGNDGGTIFSMVDESLTRIISDLSTGNTDGFMDIPLIRETFEYLGLSPADIIVRPEDAPDSMAAVERYQQRYGENLT